MPQPQFNWNDFEAESPAKSAPAQAISGKFDWNQFQLAPSNDPNALNPSLPPDQFLGQVLN